MHSKPSCSDSPYKWLPLLATLWHTRVWGLECRCRGTNPGQPNWNTFWFGKYLWIQGNRTGLGPSGWAWCHSMETRNIIWLDKKGTTTCLSFPLWHTDCQSACHMATFMWSYRALLPMFQGWGRAVIRMALRGALIKSLPHLLYQRPHA